MGLGGVRGGRSVVGSSAFCGCAGLGVALPALGEMGAGGLVLARGRRDLGLGWVGTCLDFAI